MIRIILNIRFPGIRSFDLFGISNPIPFTFFHLELLASPGPKAARLLVSGAWLDYVKTKLMLHPQQDLVLLFR